MKVLFHRRVIEQFLNLSEILYDQGYLGFEDAAIEYSERVFNDIKTFLPLKVKKAAPAYFQRYGRNLYYSAFKHSRQTTWYVFFSIHEEGTETVFLVRYLTNNHVAGHRLGLGE